MLIEDEDACINEDDYQLTSGTIFEGLTHEILTNKDRSSTFFTTTQIDDWLEEEVFNEDDAAIVIAHALIQPECNYQDLDISSFIPDIDEEGYKAIAYALSINTSLKSIVFSDGECCYDRIKENPDTLNDITEGLFLQAIRYNVNSSIEELVLCPKKFGDSVLEALKEIKPGLQTRRNYGCLFNVN